MTELIIAEMLYLQYKDRNKPMYLYINSTGRWHNGCLVWASGGAHMHIMHWLQHPPMRACVCVRVCACARARKCVIRHLRCLNLPTEAVLVVP